MEFLASPVPLCARWGSGTLKLSDPKITGEQQLPSHNIDCSVQLVQTARHSFLRSKPSQPQLFPQVIRRKHVSRAPPARNRVSSSPLLENATERSDDNSSRNRTDLSRERDRMFRFMLRFDAALYLLQAFEIRILQLPQASITAVIIIRHPEFVLEAGRDSFTLCTVFVGPDSTLVPIRHITGTRSIVLVFVQPHTNSNGFSCNQYLKIPSP
jgi:hypothetical protein